MSLNDMLLSYKNYVDIKKIVENWISLGDYNDTTKGTLTTFKIEIELKSNYNVRCRVFHLK